MLLPLLLNLPEFAVNPFVFRGSILSSRRVSLRGGGVREAGPITGSIESGARVKVRGGSYNNG